jgi:hypothetical protein
MPARRYGQLQVMHITEALHIGFYDKSLATNGWNLWTNHSDTAVSNYFKHDSVSYNTSKPTGHSFLP